MLIVADGLADLRKHLAAVIVYLKWKFFIFDHKIHPNFFFGDDRFIDENLYRHQLWKGHSPWSLSRHNIISSVIDDVHAARLERLIQKGLEIIRRDSNRDQTGVTSHSQPQACDERTFL
jgi:hypothetical protein